MMDAISALREHALGVRLVGLAKGEERPGHKYLERKPDGKGGWDYVYPEEHGGVEGDLNTLLARVQVLSSSLGPHEEALKVALRAADIAGYKVPLDKIRGATSHVGRQASMVRAGIMRHLETSREETPAEHGDTKAAGAEDAGANPEHAASEQAGDIHPPERDMLLHAISDGPQAFGGKGEVQVIEHHSPTTFKKTPVVTVKFHSAGTSKKEKEAMWEAVKAMRKRLWADHHTLYKPSPITTKNLGGTIGEVGIYCTFEAVPRGYLKDSSYGSATGVKPDTKPGAWRPPKVAKSWDAISALGELVKAAKGIEVAGHKYLMRTPDGKGGWKYSYKPPAGHTKQAGAFDPITLKHAIEQTATQGRSAPFLMPHEGKVYLATASGRYGSKEIAISGYELVGSGATADSLDFDMERSLGSYPKYVRTRRLPGGYSEAQIDQHKPATLLAVVPPPAPKKKKDAFPVWHEGQWKHVGEHEVARYERETADFGHKKSLDAIDALLPLLKATKGDEVAGHKYLTRKPDGRGGWFYVYSHAVAGGTEHARDAARHSQALAAARGGLDAASKARHDSWESSHASAFSRKAAPGLNEEMNSAFANVAKHRDAMRASEKAAGIKPEKLRTVDVHLAIRDKDGKEIRDPEATAMSAIGDYGISRGQYGIYKVTHIPSGMSASAGGALTSKAEAEHFVREMHHVAPKGAEFAGALHEAAGYSNAVAKRLAAEEKKKSLAAIDALEPLAKGSCTGCADSAPCDRCATQKSHKRVTHAEVLRAAKRLGVEWEHAAWTATDLQAGMQVELEHTPDLEKAASIALDHLCERADYYKRLRSVERGAKEVRTSFCVRRRAMKKSEKGEERPGHEYTERKPDGKGGYFYVYADENQKRSFRKEQPDPKTEAKLAQAKKTSIAMDELIRAGKLGGTVASHVQTASSLLRKHEAGMGEFKAALAAAAPDSAKVKARTKELHSVLGKIVNKTQAGKARYQTAHGLQDMTGARIVCKSVQDVKSTVANLKKNFTVIEGDDYVDQAKDGDSGLGYRSHHLILRDKDGLEKEVQIRTPFQDKHADWCHDVYKPLNEAQERVMAEKAEEIGNYARAISDYFYQVESGKMNAKKVDCPESVKSTFGCL